MVNRSIEANLSRRNTKNTAEFGMKNVHQIKINLVPTVWLHRDFG